MVLWSWSWRKGNLKDIEANDQMSKKIIPGRINGKGEGWLTGFTSKYIFLLLCIVIVVHIWAPIRTWRGMKP